MYMFCCFFECREFLRVITFNKKDQQGFGADGLGVDDVSGGADGKMTSPLICLYSTDWAPYCASVVSLIVWLRDLSSRYWVRRVAFTSAFVKYEPTHLSLSLRSKIPSGRPNIAIVCRL